MTKLFGTYAVANLLWDLPTFLQMPWNMAQRHQTLFSLPHFQPHPPTQEKGLARETSGR